MMPQNCEYDAVHIFRTYYIFGSIKVHGIHTKVEKLLSKKPKGSLLIVF